MNLREMALDTILSQMMVLRMPSLLEEWVAKVILL